MDTNAIFIAVFSVTAIGVICAAILCIASKFMYVKVDERLAELDGIMPGANCGACGFPGCTGFAKALLAGEAKPNQCPPGGAALIAKISAILGIEGGSLELKTAVVRCKGDVKAQQMKMEYKGVQTCMAAKQFFGGQSSCAYGCLGFGDCQIVCPTNAICMEDNLARIVKDLCTGCGLCVKACPCRLITIENASIPVFIACKNIEKGAVVRKKCTKGCIGCGKCVRECPSTAITMVDNLAVIDYEKCLSCCSGADKHECKRCVEVCITKCISPV